MTATGYAPSVIVTFCLAIMSGCSEAITTEYVYTRQEPTAGRSSPTVFTVRLNIDPENRTVEWLEEARDDDGYLGRVMDSWTDCNVFDRRNWNCPGVVDRIEMRDGVLLQVYFDERRTYRVRRKIFGFSLWER